MTATLLDTSGQRIGDPATLAVAPTYNGGLLDDKGRLRTDLGRPQIQGESVASLSTCYINLHPSCTHHERVHFQSYLGHWRNPGPDKCRFGARSRATGDVPQVHEDRLGVNMEPICDQLT